MRILADDAVAEEPTEDHTAEENPTEEVVSEPAEQEVLDEPALEDVMVVVLPIHGDVDSQVHQSHEALHVRNAFSPCRHFAPIRGRLFLALWRSEQRFVDE